MTTQPADSGNVYPLSHFCIHASFKTLCKYGETCLLHKLVSLKVTVGGKPGPLKPIVLLNLRLKIP